MADKKTESNKKSDSAQEKQRRLAEQLRANLRKRKMQVSKKSPSRQTNKSS